MPTEAQLAPQIEQFVHDNPQGVLTSFRMTACRRAGRRTTTPRAAP